MTSPIGFWCPVCGDLPGPGICHDVADIVTAINYVTGAK